MVYDFELSTQQLYKVGYHVEKDLETKHATYTEESQEI